MLPDTAESVPEIMQTEDTGADKIPILNPLPDTAMTVKEEIDQSLASPQDNTITLMECSSADTPSSFSGVAQCASILKNAEIGHKVKNPCDRIGPNEESFLRDPTQNSILNMRATSNSLISSLPCISSLLSAPDEIEKDKSRGKRRSRLKLKFHHQALPPEYLDHYEAKASQNKVTSSKEAAESVDVRGKEDHQLVLQNADSTVTKRSASGKKHMIISSSSSGFIKVEEEISKHELSPFVDGTIMNNFHSLPTQHSLVSNDNDSNNDLLNELTNINEVKTPCGSVSDETCVSSKGLLGTLLSGTKTSAVASKSYDEKKRNSVIITSGNAKNKISNTSHIFSSNNAADGEFRSFQDLPYMGEITLDSMKPRRGRKPKKADICHLIYKNYGTTMFSGNSYRKDTSENEELPATRIHHFYNSTSVSHKNHKNDDLKKESSFESSLKCGPDSLEIPSPTSHSNVQNRIISSLLEKRLMTSQDVKQFTRPCCKSNLPYLTRSDGSLIQEGNVWRENCKSASSVNDEPLNLCVKDLNQLKIRLLRKHDNFYEPKTCDNVIKSEVQSPNSCQETELCKLNYECPMKFRQEMNIFGGSKENKNEPHVETESRHKPFPFSEGVSSRSQKTCLLSGEPGASKNSSPLPGGYIYWPSAGIFVHPMALQSQFLYYQNMGTIPVVPISPSESPNIIPSNVPQLNLVSQINTVVQIPPITSSKKTSKKNSQSPINKISIPKTFPMIDSISKPNLPICTNDSFAKLKRLAPSANIPTTSAPVKRKRSAIFIPPIPKENSSNPTTEVSICKFKFTGGAKPSLQEKKMLSVDSGGNFRYYSGTGDKSMRGYEFFPRETLQLTGQAGSSSPEQFISAYKSGGTERATSTTLPLTSEKRSKNLQFFSELAEQSSKYDIACTNATKPEDERSDYAFLKYDHQNDISGTSKQNTTTSIDNNTEDHLNISKYSSIEKDKAEESVSNAQVRLRKKRKTRKTLAREKLEQTFKEKGFLIQTQQLESAEGATYCKFRQLRKFTRYLFRSWKDYLPGNVREMSVAAGVAVPQVSSPTQDNNLSPDTEGEFPCSKSPLPSFQHIPSYSKTFQSL